MSHRYAHRGIRNLTILHERYLRGFYAAWQRFDQSDRALPETDDRDYSSNAALLRHVLGAARGYMVWMCEKLELPDPEIRETPSVDRIVSEADDYLEHVLERWRAPLVDVTERTADRSVFESSWGVEYCIDAMLEHAVMHPVRHTFQLAELME